MVFLIDIVLYQLPILIIQFESVGRWPDHTATFIGDLISIRHDHLRVISIDILA